MSSSRGYVFVGGGLGDVARRFYGTTTYELLDGLDAPIKAICFSHNPSALQFFRYHPKHEHIVLFDLGHVYMSLLRDRSIPRGEINGRIFRLCGVEEEPGLARRREEQRIGRFHAPDHVPTASPYVVIHPFARGWGDWPEAVALQVGRVLQQLPRGIAAYIIAADYIAADGRSKAEAFPCTGPNIHLLKNLSAPAAFTLVAGAARFIGTMSALAQVAAYERVPSLVLHPQRCSDFAPPYSDYSRTIWQSNGGAAAYDVVGEPALETLLRRFLRNVEEPLHVREELSDLLSFPPDVLCQPGLRRQP